MNALRAVQIAGAARRVAPLTASEFARKVALDAQSSDIARLIHDPMTVRLVTGEVITLR